MVGSTEGYSLLNEDSGDGNVPRNNGFCPQVFDHDHDGLDDILTPAWYGLVYWFRQIEKGKFDAGRSIVGNNGNAIVMEWTHGVTAADWNNDGKLDLIVGCSHRGEQAGLIKENQKQRLAYSKCEQYVNGRQFHGKVWVFFRK